VVIYLDASALVKLVLPESESSALLNLIEGAELLVSSVVAAVEVLRAARRVGDEHGMVVGRSEEVIDGVELLWLDSGIVSTASQLLPPTLRVLDAIHLASALSIGNDLTGFVVYHRRLQEAAVSHGLPVLAPG
jgi:predicted nucleic acid-binding protein